MSRQKADLYYLTMVEEPSNARFIKFINNPFMFIWVFIFFYRRAVVKSFNMSNDCNDTGGKHFDLQRHIQGIHKGKVST